MLTQVGVKQLTDFLRTVTAASDLVDCTLVNCDIEDMQKFVAKYKLQLKFLVPSKMIYTFVAFQFNIIKHEYKI